MIPRDQDEAYQGPLDTGLPPRQPEIAAPLSEDDVETDLLDPVSTPDAPDASDASDLSLPFYVSPSNRPAPQSLRDLFEQRETARARRRQLLWALLFVALALALFLFIP